MKNLCKLALVCALCLVLVSASALAANLNIQQRAKLLPKRVLPDLVAYSLTASAEQVYVGEPVTYTLEIRNTGTADSGPFYVAMFYNPEVEEELDIYVENLPPYDGTPATAFTYEVTTTYSEQGEYYAASLADWQHNVTESNEYNNYAESAPVTVLQRLYADLVIDFFQASRNVARVGEPIFITMKWKNGGEAITDYFESKITFSPFEPPVYNIETWNLGVNETANYTLPVIYPKPGVYSISGVLDWSDFVFESNEFNNVANFSITVIPENATQDIVHNNLTASSYNLTRGEHVRFSVTLRNNGDAETGSFYTELNYDPNSPVMRTKIQTLASQEELTLTFDTSYEDAGHYNINAFADAKHEISETDEYNNNMGIAVDVY